MESVVAPAVTKCSQSGFLCAESEHLFISVLQKDVSEMQIMLVQIKWTLCG